MQVEEGVAVEEEDGIKIVAHNVLPFQWTDGAWDVARVIMPDGVQKNILILTFPNGQVGMYFEPNAMRKLGEKALKAADGAAAMSIITGPAANAMLDEIVARGQQRG